MFSPIDASVERISVVAKLGTGNTLCLHFAERRDIDCGRMANVYLCSELFSFVIVGVYFHAYETGYWGNKSECKEREKMFFPC